MHRSSRQKALGLPPALRPYASHLPALALAGAAILLLALNVFFPSLIVNARTSLTDALLPLMNVAAAPAEAAQGSGLSWSEWMTMREENRRLREENAKLKAFIPLAQQYDAENKSLRALSKYRDESALAFLSARVVGLPGGNFNNSAIVTAGTRDGVRTDMIAMTEDGVIGRVIEVGEWTSRILLLQDLNFRLPVQVEEAQVKAILSGEGSNALQLNYIPNDIEIKPGMRIATSGHGGLFPPHLPVGIVSEIRGKTYLVKPFADINRVNLVRLVRYSLAGGAQNPMNNASLPVSPSSDARR
jgi:rod shape-determining protein MreC